MKLFKPPNPKHLLTLLGGSWEVISGVICTPSMGCIDYGYPTYNRTYNHP